MGRSPAANRLISAVQVHGWDNERSNKLMIRLEWMWEERNRTVILLISATIILGIALIDWWTKPYVSLGFLY